MRHAAGEVAAATDLMVVALSLLRREVEPVDASGRVSRKLASVSVLPCEISDD